MIRVIRGAVTAENTSESIIENTKIMLEEIIKRNNIETGNIISIVFTATKDLTKAYPAVAARQLGIVQAGLMCMQEQFVEVSLVKCIRALVTVELDTVREINHVYLKEAEKLRPDLIK